MLSTEMPQFDESGVSLSEDMQQRWQTIFQVSRLIEG